MKKVKNFEKHSTTDQLNYFNGYQFKATICLFSSLLLILLPILSSGSHCAVTGLGFSIEEASVHDIQLAFKQTQLTSRQLVEFYLKQIHRLNPILKGVIEVTQKHYT